MAEGKIIFLTALMLICFPNSLNFPWLCNKTADKIGKIKFSEAKKNEQLRVEIEIKPLLLH